MKIQNIILISFLIISIACSKTKDENEIPEELKNEIAGYSNDYMKELKSVLMENMKTGGPVQAVSVCSDTASDLTNIFSETHNVEIKRVSFKNRNPQNAPDKFEIETLAFVATAF